MRWTSLLLVALACSGCSEDNTPVSPTAPGGSTPVLTPSSISATGSRAFVWVLVVDDSGICLPNATVELRNGTATQSTPQVTPCAVWDSDGGALFKDLSPGVPVTVRSSVSGYAPTEKTVTTSLGGQFAVVLTPSKIQ